MPVTGLTAHALRKSASWSARAGFLRAKGLVVTTSTADNPHRRPSGVGVVRWSRAKLSAIPGIYLLNVWQPLGAAIRS